MIAHRYTLVVVGPYFLQEWICWIFIADNLIAVPPLFLFHIRSKFHIITLQYHIWNFTFVFQTRTNNNLTNFNNDYTNTE